MKTPKPNRFIKSPILPEECPGCHDSFEFVHEQVVEESEDKTLIHGSCKKCESQLLLFQFGKDKTILSAIALLTDLTYDDVCAYWAAGQITQNDVLHVHEALQDSAQFLRNICASETN